MKNKILFFLLLCSTISFAQSVIYTGNPNTGTIYNGVLGANGAFALPDGNDTSTTYPNLRLRGRQHVSTVDNRLTFHDGTTFKKVLTTSDMGQPLGVPTLDAGNKIPLSQIPESLIGAVNFQSTYNPVTNTPTLPPASGNKGKYYVINTAGTVAGTTYNVRDWIISDGTIWDKLSQTQPVDATVTSGSANAVSGGAVYTALQNYLQLTGKANQTVSGGLQVTGFLQAVGTSGIATGGLLVADQGVSSGTQVSIGSSTPQSANHATRKDYVDAADSVLNTAINGKANTNGSNASGTWPVSVTGVAGSANLVNTTAGQMHFNWSSGTASGVTPTWVWGGNSVSEMYVYGPGELNAGSANQWKTTTFSDYNTPTGFKLLESASPTPSNGPGGSWGQGIQFSTNNNADYINQLAFNQGGSLYTRTKEGVWGSWNKIPFDGNVLHTSGDESKTGSLTVDTATGNLGYYVKRSGQTLAALASGSGGAGLNGILQLFDTPGVEGARIYASGNSWLNGGNLGIGNNNPVYKLDVTGIGRFSGVIKADTSLELSGAGYVGFNSNTWTMNHGSGGMNFTKQGTGNALFLKDNLNVGIGTNTPLTKLDVWDNTSNDLITGRVGSLGVSSFTLGGFNNDANNAGLILKTQRAGVMTEAARILANGNFGINTSNPTATLHTVGDAKVDGEMFVGTGTVNSLKTRLTIKNDNGSAKQWTLSNGIPGVSESVFGIGNLTDNRWSFSIDGTSGFASFGNFSLDSPITVAGGVPMTSGYNRTFVARDTYPTMVWNSTAGTNKYAGITYDSTAGLGFWTNGTSNNVTGTGAQVFLIRNNGTAVFNGNVDVPSASAPTHAVNKGDMDAAIATSLRPYKVYTAFITQSGTNAPTVTVLENTLGGTINWSYDVTGTYNGYLTGAFTIGKTWVSAELGNANPMGGQVRGIGNFDTDKITVQTFNASNIATNGILNGQGLLEIRVYN